VSKSATCDNGSLDFGDTSGLQESCNEAAPASCEGGIAHGNSTSKNFYPTTQVSYGTCDQNIVSKSATCDNGSLDFGNTSGLQETCNEAAPASCTGGIAHGDSATRIRYQDASVAYGSSCVSQTQTNTCDNGNFLGWTGGSWTNTSCVSGCSGGYAHGQSKSRTMYQVSSGSSCPSQTQYSTCNDGSWGSWSGTYTYTTCSQAICEYKYGSDPYWQSFCDGCTASRMSDPGDNCQYQCTGSGCYD